ncbi:50S ribosomal protein L23 [Iocasia frigidifontis]|uniref:Large ribosomal subunit protein uL23 n=1 Tax=Iocasia fonsfrigidae TaxID=2682810 RepID=A0A8A7KHP6_9FIRM|nr:MULTISPECIES: 50S ribosomal protein L23 [Halanaerobiaceae]AZO96544.1 50S ribosomal protein L23 [Halocella sp. SP3-1]QTL99298.1 50S ribosomal protein L23 [Iocasia fonsfrigidae]
MKDSRDVIISPIISEKSMDLIEENNTYTFKVARKANKVEIRNAIEDIFNVQVLKVNTMNVSGKKRRMGFKEGRTPAWKKAMVKLAAGDRLEIFEGM